MPIIVPLLVTDAAEVSLQSRAAEIIRRLSGGLRGQVYNIGASGNLSALRDEIAAALGNDMNALSTVAQLSPNVARVRLGGAYQASSKYAMLPRANTVTLLVLVPKDEGKEKKESASNTPRVLPIVLRTRIRHAVEGELLDDHNRADERRDSKEFEHLAEEYDILRPGDGWRSSDLCGDRPQLEDDFLFRLLYEVTASDYPEFLRLYRCNGGRYDEEAEELWVDLNDLSAGYGYSRTEVELPREIPPRLPAPQLALLSDDTSSGATVRLAGGKSLIADQVGAALVLPAHSTGNPRQLNAQGVSPSRRPAAQSVTLSGERRLPAQSVTRSGDDLVLTFPSLAAWKLVADNGGNPAIPQGTKIVVSRTDDECSEEKRPSAARTESCFRRYDIAYVAKAKTPDTGFSTISTVRTVAIGEKGIGSYRFALNLGKAKEVSLRGDGVVVNKVDPAQLVGKDYAWQLKNSGLVTVTFDQLTPGQHFKLILTGIEGRKEEIAIEAKKTVVEDKKSDGAK